jgi:hypothetical protein
VAWGADVLRVFNLHDFSDLLGRQPFRMLAKNLADYIGEAGFVVHFQS